MNYLLIGLLVVFLIFVFMVLTLKKRGAMITAAEAMDKIKNSKVTILDVRSAQEYVQGHIEGAKLIPVSELGNRIGELNHLKNEEILVYCHAGNRSNTACGILEKNGFMKIQNLQGGITAWTQGGNKVSMGK